MRKSCRLHAQKEQRLYFSIAGLYRRADAVVKQMGNIHQAARSILQFHILQFRLPNRNAKMYT